MMATFNGIQTFITRGHDDLDWMCGLNEPYVVVFVRAAFLASNGGSGVADMTLKVGDATDSNSDRTVWDWVDNGVVNRQVGVGSDVNWRVPKDEQEENIIAGGKRVKLAWTCPD
ncbi:MAG: hypothetical protein ACYTEQ_29025, partial [Planctomycetota bacterium]